MLTDSQKLERLTGIGGSDAAAVCGLNRWKTPYQVWREKVYGESDFIENEKTRLGNMLEPYVLEQYEEMTNSRLTRNIDTLRHSKHEFIIGHVDALDETKKIIVESKCTFNSNIWGESGTNDIPEYYVLQGAHYLNILTDYNEVHFPVLFLTQYRTGVEIFKYTRNEKLQENLLKREIDFWQNHVMPKIEPELTTTADIKQHYEEVRQNAVQASSDILHTLKQLKEVNEKIKTYSTEKKMLEAAIQRYMGANDELLDDNKNVVVTWKVDTANKRTFRLRG